MNPTHAATAALRTAENATSHRQLQELAISDLHAAPPDPLNPYGGERAIGNAFKPALRIFPYFMGQTRAAMVATWGLLALTIVLLALCVKTPSVWFAAGALFALTSMTIAAYQWIFRKWGPSSISPERYQQARDELVQSGDNHQKPIDLLEMLLLVGLMVVDGFLSGSSLTGLFSNFLTPTGAMVASIGWGIAATALLYKLVSDAALEVAINERRNSIRHLSASANPDDQLLAAQMRAAVGGKLGNDFSTQANRASARIALAVTALVLSGSTFLIRANPPAEEAAPAKTTPAAIQPAAWHA